MANSAGDGPWYPAIHARLASIAAGLPRRPAWYQQWLELGPQSSDEQRLRVYQAIRDAGVLPREAGFYLVTWHIDAMSDSAVEIELHALQEQMDALEHEHGLAEDEFWLPEEAPREYEQMRQTYQAAWDDIYVRLLRHYGESEAAEQFQHDREEFERRAEAGREYFHGPLGDDAPPWLHEFIDTVAEQMTADGPTGPLRFAYVEEDGDFWEVAVFPSPIELVGGAQDGEVVFTSFSLDLEGLREAFDSVTAMGWHSLGLAMEGQTVNVIRLGSGGGQNDIMLKKGRQKIPIPILGIGAKIGISTKLQDFDGTVNQDKADEICQVHAGAWTGGGMIY